MIWEKWQETLEPLRAALNAALGKTWQEWEIPREAERSGPTRPKMRMPAGGRRASPARRRSTPRSPPRPSPNFSTTSPMSTTPASASPARSRSRASRPTARSAVDWNDELIDQGLRASPAQARAMMAQRPSATSLAMILENLKAAGVQQAPRRTGSPSRASSAWPGRLICAEGAYMEGDVQRRAGIFIGPEFGTVSRPDLVAAAREAGDAGFDVLIACAFNYDAHSSEFERLGRVPVLKARMNADLHMGGDLKATGTGNLFVVFGEPDIEIADAGDGLIRVKVNGVDVFKPQTGEVISRRHRRHRLLVHRHRLQRGELLRPPRLLPRRERSLQGAQDDAQGRDRRGRPGRALYSRHVAPVRQAELGPHRGQGHQPPRRRGDEGVRGVAMSRMAKKPSSKKSEARIAGDAMWTIMSGALTRPRGRPNKARSLFKAVGEKIPYAFLGDIRRHLDGLDISTNGVYIAHDSMGYPRYIGRGNIFERLKARKKAQVP